MTRSYAPFSPDEARRVLVAATEESGPLLPLLRALQDHFGYLDDEAIALVAEFLNLSRAEVLGVASFYRELRREPPRGATLRLCRAEACQAMGGDALFEHARRTLASTARPGAVEVVLEEVYCLGNCARSPAALLDDRLLGRLTPEALDELLARLGGES